MFRNASPLEIWWTAAQAVGFLSVIVAACIAIYRFAQYKRKRADGTRANGVGSLVFLIDAVVFIVFAQFSTLFLWLGWLAMQTPEPIREEVKQQMSVQAIVFTVVGLDYPVLLLAYGALRRQVDVVLSRGRR